MSELIETQALSKRYGATQAVTDVNLCLQAGGIIGLVGENGAGKTTFLSMISGALEPSAGTVNVLGHPASSAALLGKVNILLQEANFKKGIAARKQLIHFARLQGMDKSAANEEISRLLTLLNNADYADKKPETMSYGQRKRMGITQTFIGKPQLILLDEPTAGLDPVAAAEVRQVIQDFSKQTTFIISSHNLYEIQDICSRIIIMDKGHVKMNTTISKLSQESDSLYITLDREPSTELMQALSGQSGVVNAEQDKANPEKITVRFSGKEADKLQLDIQSLVIEHGYSVINLSRSENLLGNILTDIAQNN